MRVNVTGRGVSAVRHNEIWSLNDRARLRDLCVLNCGSASYQGARSILAHRERLHGQFAGSRFLVVPPACLPESSMPRRSGTTTV